MRLRNSAFLIRHRRMGSRSDHETTRSFYEPLRSERRRRAGAIGMDTKGQRAAVRRDPFGQDELDAARDTSARRTCSSASWRADSRRGLRSTASRAAAKRARPSPTRNTAGLIAGAERCGIEDAAANPFTFFAEDSAGLQIFFGPSMSSATRAPGRAAGTPRRQPSSIRRARDGDSTHEYRASLRPSVERGARHARQSLLHRSRRSPRITRLLSRTS